MMPNRPPKKRIFKLLCFVAAIVFLAVACQTPNGPRLPISDQSLSVSVPEGLTRVIFLNTNYKSEEHSCLRSNASRSAWRFLRLRLSLV